MQLRSIPAALLTLIALVLTRPALAQTTYTWTGQGTSWGDTADKSWSSNGTPTTQYPGYSTRNKTGSATDVAQVSTSGNLTAGGAIGINFSSSGVGVGSALNIGALLYNAGTPGGTDQNGLTLGSGSSNTNSNKAIAGTLTFAGMTLAGNSNVIISNTASTANGGGTLSLVPTLAGVDTLNIALAPGTNTIVSGGGTATASGNTTVISANISGSTSSLTFAAGGDATHLGGNLVLSGTNTYTGGTAIGGGTVYANSATATGNGQVDVNRYGTLAGTGTVNGTVNVNSGGTLAAGDRRGTTLGTLGLTGGVTVNTGATISARLGAGGASDQLAISGTSNASSLNFALGSRVKLLAGTGYDTAATTYTLASFSGSADLLLNNGHVADKSALGTYVVGTGASGSVTLDVSALGALPTGFTFTLERMGNDLVVQTQAGSPTPEPAATVCIAAAGLGTIQVVRRRRR